MTLRIVLTCLSYPGAGYMQRYARSTALVEQQGSHGCQLLEGTSAPRVRAMNLLVNAVQTCLRARWRMPSSFRLDLS